MPDQVENSESTETVETVENTGVTKNDIDQANELPADHPLVKTLAAMKAQIKELKGKAARLDALEEAQKTDAEKAADRIVKAEAEIAAVPAKVAENLRTHLVALHSISDEDAELFLTATDPELLLKQAARLAGQAQQKGKKNHVPNEGRNTSPGEDPMRGFVRQMFSAEKE